MEFCVLGALGISANGAGIDLGGVTRRAVLGYLLLHANQVVPASRIRDALWHEDPPPSARKIVQNAVSAIRKALAHDTGQSAKLLTQVPGYRLRARPGRCRSAPVSQLTGSGGSNWTRAPWHAAGCICARRSGCGRETRSPTW